MKISPIAAAGFAFIALCFAAPGAHAACFEDIGCTDRDSFSRADLSRLSCQNLAWVRNTIYGENGYCFKMPVYRELFDDENCRFDRSGEVPLNRIERANVKAIVGVERAKGCRD